MDAPDTIHQLVERFNRNLDDYRSGRYKEAQLRSEFINPFFIALGWDVNNEQGWAEAYKEVIHEYSQKIGDSPKAPDYCFRIGGQNKFFVEAKKPVVDIKSDINPAFQLRRYAWSAKLPLSILTDFEEFAVYDCRVKPSKDDKASKARITYFKYADYIEKWDDICSVFSPVEIRKGSFDRYADTTKKKRGTAEVDDAFLEDIEAWRDVLAKHIILRNSTLSVHQLNRAVQVTIDRIIFLRICEDRGIEPYGQLRDILGDGGVYPKLVDLFRNADDRYNSGLFHFQKERDRPEPDNLTPKLKVDDKILRDILGGLYYPDSPYEFSVLPADILGQVYERFLGKVIRLTKGGRAKVEEKPEVRKAGGVYYTPTYIVDYIVENTVGKLLDGKTPKKIEKLRILDPACGSGSFLIGAYQYLLDRHIDYYSMHKPQELARKRKPPIYKTVAGDWKLTTAERKRILLNNIYGVDIDTQAVEVTKLSLLLKVLEDESKASLDNQLHLLHERALPDLSDNIKCGNSLIGTDYYDNTQMSLLDDEESRRINVFDWEAEFPDIFKGKKPGFDAVIGNPPYDVLEKERGESSWPHSSLREYVKCNTNYEAALGGKLNLFRFFVVRGLQLNRKEGWFGMIIPLALLADVSCSQTRRNLLLSTKYLVADCFPQKDNRNRRVFYDAKLSTMVVTGQREKIVDQNKAQVKVRVYPWNNFTDACKECNVRLIDAALLDPKSIPIPLADNSAWKLCMKIHKSKNVTRLGEIKDFTVNRGEINQTIYRKFISNNHKKSRLMKGVEIGRFYERKKLSQGFREWFDEKAFLRESEPKPIVRHRRIATQRITGVDEKLRIVATIIEPPAYFADSTNSVITSETASHDLLYLLGLLNSILFQWRFKITSTNNNVGTNELDSLPFRIINFSDPSDKASHDKMVKLVERMLKLHKQLHAKRKTQHEKTVIQRQITATDKAIDKLVYELYGLTDDEIRIVEEDV